MLTDGHRPNGFAQSGRGGEPDVDVDVRRTECPTSAFPAYQERGRERRKMKKRRRREEGGREGERKTDRETETNQFW